MELHYFRQINLPFKQKAAIVGALMRFIVAQRIDVPRSAEFDKRFIAESEDPPWLKNLGATDPWLPEHIARIFWICCELGFLKYQYPYPHKGQTYRPTRIGRWMTMVPNWGTPHDQIDYLVKHIKDVFAASPTIAVEEALGQIRLNDSFTPEPSDASDLQHALTPLAHCDYFVTDDRQLREHCRIAVKKLKLKCQVVKSVEEVPIQGGTTEKRRAAKVMMWIPDASVAIP